MKRFFYFLTLLSALMLSTACFNFNKSERLLQETIKDLKLTVPQDLSDGVTWTDIKIDEQNMTYVYTSREPVENVEETFADLDMKKAEIHYGLATQYNGDLQTLFDALKDTNRGMIYIYKGLRSKKEIAIETTPEEMQLIDWSDLKDLSKKYLDHIIANINAGLPEAADEITVFDSVTRQGDIVSYNYTVYEDSEFSIQDLLDADPDDVKEALLPDLSDPEIVEFETLLKNAGCKLRYQYSGNKTGLDYVMTINPMSHTDVE